jgi:hypothetical protein
MMGRCGQGARPIVSSPKATPASTHALRSGRAFLHVGSPSLGGTLMIYILAALVPPLGLLLNGQPFSALLNLVLIVFCVLFGLIFPVLFLVPSIHALIAVHMKREDRKHRELVDAIERHGPPPDWRP